MSNGILYIAFKKHKDADHIKELIHSVKSVRKFHKDLNITLFTNNEIEESKYFNNIKKIEINSERVKQNYLYDSPYDNTLYLDTDTEIINPIDDLFLLLERFDICAAIDPIRKDNNKNIYEDYKIIPESFPEFAGGVILFRKSKDVENFFNVWKNNYEIWKKVSGRINDQPPFRVSLWQSQNLKLFTLPPEYNLRTQEKRDKFKIEPKIFHWHDMYKPNLKRTYQKF